MTQPSLAVSSSRAALMGRLREFGRRFPAVKRIGLSVLHTLSLLRMSPLARGDTAYDGSRKTVILAVHSGSFTGAPILAWNLAKRLSETHNVVAIMMERGPLTELFRPFCVALTYPRVGSVRNSEPALFRRFVLERAHARYKADSIIANSVESEVAVTAGAMLGIPTIALVHEFAEYTSRDRLTRLLNAASVVIFSSRLVLDSAEKSAGCKIENAVVEPQGQCEIPATGTTRSQVLEALLEERRSDGAFLCIGCGHVQMRKGVDIFVAVAARVLRSGLNARFVWIGDGYDPEQDFTLGIWIKDQIERSGFGARIKIIPAVSAEDMGLIYESADAMLLSSRLDPLPNVAIDALHAATPVVCFESASGLPEYLSEQEGLDTLIVPYLDAGAAADRIKEMAENPEMRRLLSMGCADLARERFDMSAYTKSISGMVANLSSDAQRNV